MSIIGSVFRVTTFGESHGLAVGCVLEGVPSGMEISEPDIQPYLDRRRPGQSSITTTRSESDSVQILSGVELGRTLGTPIAMIVYNEDMRKRDYEETSRIPRPGHADYTYQVKYGYRASSGGGRASARETVGRVCAGAFAQKYLSSHDIQVVAFVDSVMEISIPEDVREHLLVHPPSQTEVDELGRIFSTTDPTTFATTRCPDKATAARMVERICELQRKKDSCGGTVTGVISGLPAGLGEPVFDKFHAELGKAMLSIPAVKGFEVGSGFSGSERMTGSENNDCFIPSDSGRPELLSTSSNHAGGVLGGITNGQNVFFRVAFKPVSSIGVEQSTTTFDGQPTTLELQGRHDPCVLPRAVPIVEAMAAIVTMDFVLRQKVRN
jgi:chorismate synthase